MKLKEKFKTFYNDNKGLIVTALLLNVTFTILVILSLCGVNIVKINSSNEFLSKLTTWAYHHNLIEIIYGIMFASNVYFAVAISSNDYTHKALIYTLCLTPVFVILQYCIPNVNPLIMSYLIPFCVCISYSFKFSTMWKCGLFLGIVTLYQYLMRAAKLTLFNLKYLTVDLLTYLILSIDLYVVFIFYFCICKTIYKNKLKKEEG